jgi:hypothetical protein
MLGQMNNNSVQWHIGTMSCRIRPLKSKVDSCVLTSHALRIGGPVRQLKEVYFLPSLRNRSGAPAARNQVFAFCTHKIQCTLRSDRCVTVLVIFGKLWQIFFKLFGWS